MADSKRPFWMHQLVEYVLGGALISSGLQSPTPLMPALMGGLIVLHAACTKGGFAAFRVIDRTLHGKLDLAIIGIQIVAVIQPWIAIDSGTRFLMGVIAAAHAFVWWQSSFEQKVKRPPVSMEGGRGAEVGRMTGRFVGDNVNRWRNR